MGKGNFKINQESDGVMTYDTDFLSDKSSSDDNGRPGSDDGGRPGSDDRGRPGSDDRGRKNRIPGWGKGLIIFGLILLFILILAFACGRTGSAYSYSDDYIGKLYIEGEISTESSSSLLSSSDYDQQFLLDRVDAMIKDTKNKGIILYVNTPGGSTYASDEMYLKLMEYKKKTGRPVYSYFGPTAASGGYYIASASDKIVANRNTWTGSIGVTIGTIYDLTGLLDKLGIKTVTIDSGVNKSMGSSVESLTGDQKKILQSLIDEAYDQFVNVVAKGRAMKLSKVKTLADGRIYSAKQAKENGLIDGIGSFDDAVKLMKNDNNLNDVKVEDIAKESSDTFMDKLLSKIFSLGTSASSGTSDTLKSDTAGYASSLLAGNDYQQIQALIEANNKFTINYKTNIVR